MATLDIDKSFSGAIPQLYDRYLVPMIFEPYAADLATRVARKPVRRVLEVAAGTGVVTRALARTLPESVSIVATDLNAPMLDHAAAIGTSRPVEWKQADVMQLPFADATFDAVVCQFGAMFFPDKARAFAEMRRVLRPGGTCVFSVWDRLEENEFTHEVTLALEKLFPDDPPRFMERTPHGYYNRAEIARHLAAGGFAGQPQISTKTERSRAESPQVPAFALVQGTPLRNEIEARDGSRLEEATTAAAEALANRFGRGAIEGKMQGLVVEVCE